MSIPSKPLIARLEQVRERIHHACVRYGRDPAQVQLLAVSKTFPVTAIEALLSAGQTAFGESYVQEAMEKIPLLGARCQWHFIGPLQSNKCPAVATHFAWVHSLERLKIAQHLSRHRPAGAPPLQVCLQVNISQEASKSGVSLNDLPLLARQVSELPGLQLRGLMTIPRPCEALAQQRIPFRELRHAFDRLKQQGYSLDTLSMGMSSDLEAAIAEGSTLVRVGRALFGPR